MSKPTSLREQQANIDAVTDRFARNTLRAAYHVRRHALLYIAGVIALIALALFPTVASGGGGGGSNLAAGGTAAGSAAGGLSSSAGRNGSAAASSDGASGSVGSPATPGFVGSAGAGSTGSGLTSNGAAGPVDSNGAATAPQGVQTGSGVTVAGVACHPGVRQIPFSQYADPCVAHSAGANGGATADGVTANTITIAVRKTADAQGANALAVEAEAEAAGGVSFTVEEQYTRALIAYFNKNFELYGRQIKLVDFNGQGNDTNESLGQGQAAACADADALATSVHAFGVLDWEGNYLSDPFSECASRYHLYVPLGAAYYPESEYQSLNPYVWSDATNCTLGGEEEAEFIGKQLAPYPATWAGADGAFNMYNTPRKFATYVPNNAGYQQCVGNTADILKSQYHVASSRLDQYNYALDISQFPEDSERASIQFSADRDTSVILASDPLSPIFLTQDALQQDYHPEWVLIGVALTDSDNLAQLWDQSEIDGHLFGLSQAGDTASELNPQGEAGRVLTAIGLPVNPSSALDYYELLSMVNQLQAAGPVLTAQNIAAGTQALPQGGGPTGAFGTWHFGSVHTAIIDSREIYWNGSAKSRANNKAGTYVAAYGGTRFQLGGFPSGAPPFYP